ncbi:hypothetical protein [Dactylosporangium darangshiense]|uniref:Uncharacterized protein n=1 Tax=Dactylosporangium darangshiense TaxID=579108 RepID=A0ABP8DUX6_9ACTN
MTDELQKLVLDAHGGLKRWSEVNTLVADLSVDGPFWQLRGFPHAFLEEHIEVAVHRQHIAVNPWVSPDTTMIFDADTQQVSLTTTGNRVVDSLTAPRLTFADYDISSPWESLQVGYFLGYAMWNYLTTPFLFTFPGVRTREIQPWEESGQTWRRLHVTFPENIATHTAQQVFYYDSASMLRRLDYTVDVNADVPVAHYVDDYKTFDGLVFPTRRRVHRRKPDGTANLDLASITIDIHNVTSSSTSSTAS